jgi:hypothetical protein
MLFVASRRCIIKTLVHRWKYLKIESARLKISNSQELLSFLYIILPMVFSMLSSIEMIVLKWKLICWGNLKVETLTSLVSVLVNWMNIGQNLHEKTFPVMPGGGQSSRFSIMPCRRTYVKIITDYTDLVSSQLPKIVANNLSWWVWMCQFYHSLKTICVLSYR